MAQLAASARPFDVAIGIRSWTVVDYRGIPIEPVEEYLFSLRATGRAANTVKSYARHLSLFWRWLEARQLEWDQLTFAQLSDFVFTYRQGLDPLRRAHGDERSAASTRAVAASVKEFIEYHRLEGRGPGVVLSRSVDRSRKTANHFLAHVERRRPVERNRLTVGHRDKAPSVKILEFESDFERLLRSCHSYRDRLLISALYDGGLRIGQALGLRHGDLNIPEQRLSIVRRENNANEAVSKTTTTLDLKVHGRFFDLYSRYLLRELVPRGIESDYLFVNLDRAPIGAPCSYSSTYRQLVSIAERAGIEHFHPHMLRHTHGTALAKAGWTSAEIAARLGHRHASTADIYIHLAATDLDEKYARTVGQLGVTNG